MKRFFVSFFFAIGWMAASAQGLSFCNPLDLNYRFMIDEPSRREAADPVVVLFNDKYYLFASKSGGYWISNDMVRWNFITNGTLPWEDYAPTAVVMGNEVYFMAMDKRIYRSTDPSAGIWDVVKENMPIDNPGDPCLFLDEDGRLYLYSGLSARLPTYGVEVDTNTWELKGEQVECILSDKEKYGWERPKDDNSDKKHRPWVEGSWMNKIGGKYWMQYAVPGTQYKSYCDGLYVADRPLGPFRLVADNPFAYKPEGFICGVGHGCTFQDRYGNWWHAGTMTISVRHQFERRIGLFPVFLGADGTPHTYTGYGDFPHKMPNRKMGAEDDYLPQWMLLSYGKPVTASSTLNGHPEQNATDENIRTWWSAATEKPGEWLMVDLQSKMDVAGVQVNFADEGATLKGRSSEDYYHYTVETSADGKKWKIFADRSVGRANTHEYHELAKPVKAQFVRVTSNHQPSGKMAVSGLRVFGHAGGKRPAKIKGLSANRNQEDRCQTVINWEPVEGAVGYNVRYGTTPDRLWQNYQVLGNTSVSINSLNSEQDYYLTVDAFNENGITKGTDIKHLE